MKINKILAVSVLIIASGFIIIVGSIHTDQVNPIPEESLFILSAGNAVFVQENLKYQYIGMEKCASVCHNNEAMGFQYFIVKNSPHAKAFSILFSKKAIRYSKNANIKENPQESSACLKCHVTGGGLDSSSLTSTYKKEDGVTCEACHKGEFISKTFLPKEADCLKCHNDSVHKMHKFDFNADCAKISHPRPNQKGNGSNCDRS